LTEQRNYLGQVVISNLSDYECAGHVSFFDPHRRISRVGLVAQEPIRERASNATGIRKRSRLNLDSPFPKLALISCFFGPLARSTRAADNYRIAGTNHSG
jgi:hypothetical protein